MMTTDKSSTGELQCPASWMESAEYNITIYGFRTEVKVACIVDDILQ